jgi:hypothetical protein
LIHVNGRPFSLAGILMLVNIPGSRTVIVKPGAQVNDHA